MVSVFTAVGEHQVDTMRLLVLGIDGSYYAYNLMRQTFLPVNPDRDWVVYGRSGAEMESVCPEDEVPIPGARELHPVR